MSSLLFSYFAPAFMNIPVSAETADSAEPLSVGMGQPSKAEQLLSADREGLTPIAVVVRTPTGRL